MPIKEEESDKIARMLRRKPMEEVILRARKESAFDSDLIPSQVHLDYLFITEEFLYEHGYTRDEFFTEISNDVVSKANRQTRDMLQRTLNSKLQP